MIARRDLLIGGTCAAALGAAEYLRPRRILRLFPQDDIGLIIPESFGRWRRFIGGQVLTPPTEGSLADQLYAETVQRIYHDDSNASPVMLLVAYGPAQSDLLQLHRPESCYPAFGFTIRQRALFAMPVGPATSSVPGIPAVRLTATLGGRIEDVVYWARLGERLPQTAGEQRADRLRIAMQGYVADGVLVRASALREDGAGPQHGRVQTFLQDMLRAVPAADLKALIGTSRAAGFSRSA